MFLLESILVLLSSSEFSNELVDLDLFTTLGTDSDIFVELDVTFMGPTMGDMYGELQGVLWGGPSDLLHGLQRTLGDSLRVVWGQQGPQRGLLTFMSDLLRRGGQQPPPV